MAQHRRGAGFAAKPEARGLVRGKFGLQNLDRNLIADLHAARPVDMTHTAFADAREQLILAFDSLTYQRIRID